jgi:hypothetical protein
LAAGLENKWGRVFAKLDSFGEAIARLEENVKSLADRRGPGSPGAVNT